MASSRGENPPTPKLAEVPPHAGKRCTPQGAAQPDFPPPLTVKARGPYLPKLATRAGPSYLLTNHTVVGRAPGSQDYQFVRRPVVNQIDLGTLIMPS